MKTYFLRVTLYAICFFLLSCDGSEKSETTLARPVKAIQIGNSQSFNKRSFPARAKASQEVNLSFNVGGSLINLPVKIGDSVKKGDLIAKLDPRDFESRLKSAQAELVKDEKNFQRAESLLKKSFISQAEYDLLQTKVAVSKSNQDIAEKALKDTVIHAPFTGQISDLYVENFQTVASKEAIARLLDISHVEMVIQIPENVISLIPSAKDIMVEFDAFPNQMVPAKIKEISSEASADTRTYPVTIIMEQPKDFQILSGMAGKVRGNISQKEAANNMYLPVSAVMTETGQEKKTYVWIINPESKRVERREIQIGELATAGIAVKSGINSGEWVVTAGIHSLKEGEQVSY